VSFKLFAQWFRMGLIDKLSGRGRKGG